MYLYMHVPLFAGMGGLARCGHGRAGVCISGGKGYGVGGG